MVVYFSTRYIYTYILYRRRSQLLIFFLTIGLDVCKYNWLGKGGHTFLKGKFDMLRHMDHLFNCFLLPITQMKCIMSGLSVFLYGHTKHLLALMGEPISKIMSVLGLENQRTILWA